MTLFPRVMRLSQFFCLFVILQVQPAAALDLKQPTREAFDHYVTLTEQNIDKEESSPATFLYIDQLSEKERADARAQLQKGEVVIHRRATHDADKIIDVPHGMIHHWVGTVFVPGVSLQSALTLLQDYNQHSKVYAPTVERSKLLERKGSDFKIYYRLRQKKVVTVVMDAYYDVHYGPVEKGHSTSRSRSTKIQEISNAGAQDEKAGAPDDGNGFMWRLNTYWRYQEKDGGLYIQCEAVSLSRDIPAGLGWMIRSYVESVPRESLLFTLGRTKDQLSARH